MDKQKRQFWVATMSLVGAIVGVGIFGVPYVISRIGAVPALGYFLVLGAVQLLQHLFFAETAIACRAKHNLPGFARLYLGSVAGRIGGLAVVLGYWAALTAYVAVGGTFLASIVAPILGGEAAVYSIVWAVAGALVVKFGLKTVSRFEFVGTIGLILALVGVLGASAPKISPENLTVFNWLDPIVPYGVILFSLSGLTQIPEMEHIVEGRHGDYRRAVALGTVLAAVITAAFGFVVWGVSGSDVSQDSVTGLRSAIGPWIAIPAAVAGFLAIATSYFSTASNLKDTFNFDFERGPTVAWLMAVAPPLIMFLFGGRDFLKIIGFSGAVFGGIVAILVGLLFLRVRSRGLVRLTPLKVPAAAAWAVIAVVSLGAVIEVGDYAKSFLSR